MSKVCITATNLSAGAKRQYKPLIGLVTAEMTSIILGRKQALIWLEMKAF